MFTISHFIIIPQESHNNENDQTISYTAEYIINRFNQAYDSKDGKGLLYWLDMYEKYYGINDIVS